VYLLRHRKRCTVTRELRKEEDPWSEEKRKEEETVTSSGTVRGQGKGAYDTSSNTRRVRGRGPYEKER
jgi:hypothetical protein